MGYLVRQRTLARFACTFEGVFWLVGERFTADSAHTKFLCKTVQDRLEKDITDLAKNNNFRPQESELLSLPGKN